MGETAWSWKTEVWFRPTVWLGTGNKNGFSVIEDALATTLTGKLWVAVVLVLGSVAVTVTVEVSPTFAVVVSMWMTPSGLVFDRVDDVIVIGLSGGIDSSLVAVIAVDALGPENVLGVAMPGPYSSEGSVRDASRLAENLGIRLLTMDINETFSSYRKTLEGAFAGRPEDTAEENLQARIRGNLLMALSNKFGSLVLSTGNKSEMAVGYCTLYGDMAGGLAVISDLPKIMVYELAGFANRGRKRIPDEVFAKPPSAELRPNQTDMDSLPPYEILDRILKAYVEDLRAPDEIASQYGFSLDLVRSVAVQVDRNEYKRKQAPPGLKVTSKAFSVGRRFPLAQKYSL